MEENNARNRSPQCWQKLSKAKKITIIVVTCATALILIITTVLLLTLLKSDSKVCTTSACLDASKSMRSFMDDSVDPCDHFYNFACGKFVKDTKLNSSFQSIDQLSIQGKEVEAQLNKLLNEPISNNELRPSKIIKMTYKSCMDEPKVTKDTFAFMKSLIEKLGGWPVVVGEGWKEDSFDWKETIYKFKENGLKINKIFEYGVISYPYNTKKQTIVLAPPDALSGQFGQFSTKIKRQDSNQSNERLHLIMQIATIFGARGDKVAAELNTVLRFEQNLQLLSENINIMSPGITMTISEMEQKYSGIPWLDFFSKLFGPDAQITASDVVYIINSTYIAAFTSAIQSTSKRDIANFMVWSAIESVLPLTGGELFKIFLRLSSVEPDRSVTCQKLIIKQLPIACAALYIRKYFNKENRIDARSMAETLEKNFENRIKENDWMDKITGKAAQEKVQEMVLTLAFPDELVDDKEVESYYAEYNHAENNFCQSILNTVIFNTRLQSKELRRPYNRSAWFRHANVIKVNAFYYVQSNTIDINAAILSGHFFNTERPKFMNFARAGSIIGHEITHGFDNEGRRFDKYGNLKNWWDSETDKKFQEKSQCMIDQYNGFKVDTNLTVDGIKTLGENIADNGGFSIAYRSYKAWASENGDEPGLPDLKYDTLKLFWISAAQAFCGKSGKEAMKATILTDTHSPNEYRIIASFANNADFAKDFGCKEGSYMNPKKKCKVW